MKQNLRFYKKNLSFVQRIPKNATLKKIDMEKVTISCFKCKKKVENHVFL